MDARILQRGHEGAVTSLVFPTYNPGPMLERTWRELMRFLQRAPGSWEVLFVCDGCTDGTPARLATLARAEAERIRVLTHAPNRGKGYAVRRGLEAARGEWRLFTDVDLAYGFDDVLRVAEALQAGAPVAIASRSHPESQMLLPTRLQGYAYRRYVQSLAFSALVRWLLPLKYRDTQAGLKGLCAAAAGKILPCLMCDGFGFDCELLTACVRYGLAVREVPVCVRYEDRASTTGFRATKQMLKELWQIRRSWRQLGPAEPDGADASHRQAA
jgi:dolichyl-phosphate beta-glucosyltransferase